jgi:hypothetical protein
VPTPRVRTGQLWPAVLATWLTATVTATTASADSVGVAQVCPVEPGYHLHDGFFARSEAGVTLLEATVSDSGQSPRRSRIRAIGQSASVNIGATPAKGLVLGISIWTAILDPTFVENGRTIIPDDNSITLTLLHVGPFLDWYSNPRGGYHAFGSMGFAAHIERDSKGNPIYPVPKGITGSTGAGYEWFVSSDMSVGVLGRLAFGWLTRTPVSTPERMLFVAPELAFTATYH